MRDDLTEQIPDTMHDCAASLNTAATHCYEQWLAWEAAGAPRHDHATWEAWRAGYIAGRAIAEANTPSPQRNRRRKPVQWTSELLDDCLPIEDCGALAQDLRAYCAANNWTTVKWQFDADGRLLRWHITSAHHCGWVAVAQPRSGVLRAWLLSPTRYIRTTLPDMASSLIFSALAAEFGPAHA